MKTRGLLIGLHAVDEGQDGWRRILQQEGLPYRVADEPVSGCGLFSEHLPNWFETWVAAGNVAVISGATEAGDLLPSSIPAVIHRFRPPEATRPAYAPGPARLYAGEGFGEIRLHEDRKIKAGNDPDVYPLVLEQSLGKGSVIYSGVNLARLLMMAGDCLRRFSPFTEVDERVASIDKAEVSDTLIWMLRRAFRAWGMPYLRPVRFPNGAPSVFVLRIDVDGLFGSRTRRLAEVGASYGIPMSFYFNGELCEEIPGDLDGWPEGHEISQHGYRHNIYSSVAENAQNLVDGADWLRGHLGIESDGFVAPRGLWNEALEEALIQARYAYSSDFALEFDSLPFRTPRGVLQIPVHPYSPERATVYAEERGLPTPSAASISSYYRAVLEEQVRRHRPAHFYGHPEVMGFMAEEILPPLFEQVSHLGCQSETLRGLAAWWKAREETEFTAEHDPDEPRLDIRVSRGTVPLEVFARHRLTVNDGTVTRTVPEGARLLVGGEA